jgi:hypothetical protein
MKMIPGREAVWPGRDGSRPIGHRHEHGNTTVEKTIIVKNIQSMNELELFQRNLKSLSMFTILLDLFSDIIKFLLTILAHFISILQSPPQPLPTADSLPNRLICLQAQRSALIAQRDLILHQIADLDAFINLITDSNQASNPLSSPQLSQPHLHHFRQLPHIKHNILLLEHHNGDPPAPLLIPHPPVHHTQFLTSLPAHQKKNVATISSFG